MKFLMLEYASESLKFEKVYFPVDERNTRSRQVVKKLGATLGGILRKNVIILDGYKQYTCNYGILNNEWPKIKMKLFA
ncbi:GNAT family N-acetyltransferase [Aestuariibaculum sediminum]|uniref:GNAT family N-acetyltransferase n=1 Tax=Aestuariibaculum sediminum TaxID=2770637 RepID=UPI001CB756B3|nr:GNAT family protein [Aestuariibaculum sediminum]